MQCSDMDTHAHAQKDMCNHRHTRGHTDAHRYTDTHMHRHAAMRAHTYAYTQQRGPRRVRGMSVRKAKTGRRFEMKMGHDSHQHLSVTAAHHSGVRGLDPSLD